MLIQLTAPCYLCGKDSVVDGLCGSCYNQQHPLIEVSTPLSILACKRCGSVKVPGGWKKLSIDTRDPDEQAERQMEIILEQEIKLLAPGVSIEFEEEKKLDRVTNIVVYASGQSHESLPIHEENYNVEMRFSYGTCDTCGKMSGGYYEAILQIRADGREITTQEKEELTQKVTEMTIMRYRSDDKAFVTMIDDNKYGIDYYIGSEHLIKEIADEFERQYVLERKENYKLVGEDKTGKQKFRITILLRLPRFSVGDFVLINEQPCQVLSMSRNNLTCYDLVSRERFTINPKSAKWRTLQFLAPISDRREYMIVTYVDGQPVQIMDSNTFDVTEIEEEMFESEIVPGSKVYGILIEDQLYLLPDQTSFMANNS